MRDIARWRTASFATLVLILLSGILVSGAQQEQTLPVGSLRPAISSSDCTYLQNPDEFAIDPELRYIERTATTGKLARFAYDSASTAEPLDAAGIPRKNFIDNAIFDRMASAGI